MLRSSTAGLFVLVAFLVRSPLHGQEVLERFTYDSLGFNGIALEVGVLWGTKVESAAQVGVRVDLGELAPRLRTIVGISYFQSALTAGEIRRLEESILPVVDDPSGTATVSLGSVTWSDLALAMDFQYILNHSRRWIPYLGLGLSLHLRNGWGDEIRGSIIEDILDQLQVGLDLTGGVDLRLTPALVLNVGGRGVVTGSLNTFTLGVGLGYRVP